MKTLVAASLAAVMAAGSGYAIAQTGPGRDGPRGDRQERAGRQEREGRQERFMQEDLPALTDARIAGLKAGLRLNAEQERLWAPVETALRDMAALRTERMTMMRERRAQGTDARGPDAMPRPDLMERLDRMADGSRKTADSLGKLRDAAKPLYATFDERQKRLLPVLIGGRNGLMAGGHRGAWRDHHARGGHHDRYGQSPRGDWDNGPRGDWRNGPRGERL